MPKRLPALALGAAAFFLPFILGLFVHQQGFNLLDDGVWLLGARTVAEGGLLYGDLFTIYGPARFYLLAPFLLLLGKSVWTLAVFKACLDGAAGLFGYRLARRLGAGHWALIVPVGVIALGPVLPRYLAAALFAFWSVKILSRPADRRSCLVLGAIWGGLSLFGLDMAGYGGVILVLGLATVPTAAGKGWSRPGLAWGQILAGMASVLGTALVLALVLGILPVAIWDTVIYPATQFKMAMGISWVESFRSSPALHEVFAGHHTGEILDPVWPGQAGLRALGLRLMFLLAWVLPVWGLLAARRRHDLPLAMVAALGMAGWATLLARGDVEHLRLIWFGVLLLVPLLMARLSGRAVEVAAVVIALALGPLAAEQIWLAANAGRAGLEVWERETAGIRLATERRDQLEALCADLKRDPDAPVLVWPSQPGLHFVLGAPLSTSQITLLPGEVRDPVTVIADLDLTMPPVAVLGPAWGLASDIRSTRALAPSLYSNLRHNYLKVDEYTRRGENYKTLARVSGGAAAVEAAPLPRRLPGAAQYLKSATTPVFAAGVSVAQSFEVADFDLAGVTLMFSAPGPFPYEVSLKLTFIDITGPAAERVLAELPIRLSLEEGIQKRSFPFSPLRGSSGRTLVMEIRGNEDGNAPFALLWHRPERGDPAVRDSYPEGQAFHNGRPVLGDLYFITY